MKTTTNVPSICTECGGKRYIGSPPDGYESCPLCNPEPYQVESGIRGWKPISEAGGGEMWVCDINEPGSVRLAFSEGGKWFLSCEEGWIELFPTHCHPIVPDMPERQP